MVKEMKKLPSVKATIGAIIVICLIQFVSNQLEQITILTLDSSITTTGNSVIESLMLKNERDSFNKSIENSSLKQEIEIVSLKASSPEIVFEGMTLEELGSKLDLSLNSTLKGYGLTFAKYSIEYGVDPYLALAITLHETGCTWTCSSLVRSCNNVGGMKGAGSCNGGSYATFNSLEEGIEAMISNLSRNYIAKGLTTPETIGRKYAASSIWPEKINYYISKIRNA